MWWLFVVAAGRVRIVVRLAFHRFSQPGGDDAGSAEQKYQSKEQIDSGDGRNVADLSGERLAEDHNQDAAGEQGGSYAWHDVPLSFFGSIAQK